MKEQRITLQEFFIKLAVDPGVQQQMSEREGESLHHFLIEQGLSADDAQLLVDAHRHNPEGKQKLVAALNDSKVLWVAQC